MAEQRRLEVTSVIPERKLVIAERSNSRPDERYAIRVHGGTSLERIEVFSEAAMLRLAEFVDPQGSRTAEFYEEITRLHRQLDSAVAQLAEARQQLNRVQRYVEVLLGTLDDAWWLRAAEAYRSLEAWVRGEV